MRKSKLFYLTTRNTQLQNDLDAARKHLEEYRKSELKLLDEINTMRINRLSSDVMLTQMTGDRDDWRDAFKLIMKLVK